MTGAASGRLRSRPPHDPRRGGSRTTEDLPSGGVVSLTTYPPHALLKEVRQWPLVKPDRRWI
jgi:hypothetical protein